MALISMVEIGYLGAIYVGKIRQSIRTLPQCFDPQLDTVCTPIGWSIYGVQFVLLVTVFVRNIYQYRTRCLSKGSSKILNCGIWLVRSFCLLPVISQSIWFVSDYFAFKPLLNFEESKWEYGQILTLGISIVSNVGAIAHLAGLGGKPPYFINISLEM
jgi:hypothetical protein